MNFMYKTLLILFLVVFSCSNNAEKPTKNEPNSYLNQHSEALKYCRLYNFSEDFYFLIDLSIHSGKNRFFVYDFNNQSVIKQGLVTHGSCDVLELNPTKYEKAKFSNKNNSHCSSLGKYKIGKRDYSSWGINIKYWLDGLENSNSNARNRVVVLHSWNAVSETEIYPNVSPLSWGCPAVSNKFMQWLDTKLQTTEKPILLWIIK